MWYNKIVEGDSLFAILAQWQCKCFVNIGRGFDSCRWLQNERLHMLKIVPVELRDANAFIEQLHRHHKRVQGHRFSIGAVNEKGILVGIACVGRPVARGDHPREVLEVTRLCTDGTKNACSFLYSACARIGRELGYKRIQTYILESESGTSLVAAGWQQIGVTAGGQWKHTDGKPRRTDQPTCPKKKFGKTLNI